MTRQSTTGSGTTIEQVSDEVQLAIGRITIRGVQPTTIRMSVETFDLVADRKHPTPWMSKSRQRVTFGKLPVYLDESLAAGTFRVVA